MAWTERARLHIADRWHGKAHVTEQCTYWEWQYIHEHVGFEQTAT